MVDQKMADHKMTDSKMADSKMTEHAVIDRAEVLNRLEGDEELLVELIDSFFAESEMLMEQVARAVSSMDAPGVERAAHKLKGTVSIFCAGAAVESALTLETMGREGDQRNCQAVWTELHQHIRMLEKALREWREETCLKS